MISGALFLNKSSSFKKIFKKNIVKIGISFIFWSLVYCIKEKFINIIKLKDFVLQFMVSHYHLRFLFSIIKLYMIVPFLLLIIEKKNHFKLFSNLISYFYFYIEKYTFIF